MLKEKYQNQTSDSDEFLKSNMPNTIGSIFYVLFDDETWTWSGLAKILVDRFGIIDLGELDYYIKEELNKKGENNAIEKRD
jgi:hypothetical protein